MQDARAGGLARTEVQLAALEPGDAAWFWMTERGPGDTPFLAIDLQRDDPEGRAFAVRARELSLLSSLDVEPVFGDLRMMSGGRLVFTTRGEIGQADDILEALATRPGCERLRDAVILSRGQDGFTAVERVEPHDYGLEAELVEELDDEELVFFWLTDVGEDRTPSLRLSTDRAELRQAARLAAGTGRAAAGRVKLGDDGRIELHTSRPFANMVGALARWTCTYEPGWPSLARLRRARVVVRGEEGDVLLTLQSDLAWEHTSAL